MTAWGNEHRQMVQVMELIARIDRVAGSEAGQSVHELVQVLLEMHGEGLKRIVRAVKQAGPAGEKLLDALAGDEYVAGLLLLHDLHPASLEARVGRAVDKVRGYLRSHGHDVELMGISEGAVSLRMKGDCQGCPTLADSLKMTIEKAIYDAAPDASSVTIQAAGRQPDGKPDGQAAKSS